MPIVSGSPAAKAIRPIAMMFSAIARSGTGPPISAMSLIPQSR
ncbi:hypothetical protein ACU4GA_13970 [Methylobacterium oryzae CBMB20]